MNAMALRRSSAFIAPACSQIASKGSQFYRPLVSTPFQRSQVGRSFYSRPHHRHHHHTRGLSTSPTATMIEDRVKLPTDLPQPVLRQGLGTDVSIVPGAPLETIKADLLILALKSLEGEQDWVLPAKVAAFDKEHVSSVLAECIEEAEFKGKTGSSTDMVRLAGGNIKRYIVYGIGKGESKDIAKAAAFAVSKGKGKCSSVALYVEGGADGHIATIAEATNVEAYEDKRYKGTKDEDDKPRKPPAEIAIVGESTIPAAEVERGQAFAVGIGTVRESLRLTLT